MSTCIRRRATSPLHPLPRDVAARPGRFSTTTVTGRRGLPELLSEQARSASVPSRPSNVHDEAGSACSG